MSEYQAIYDAVRSRISNGNIGDAVERALRECNLSHYSEMMMRAFQNAVSAYEAPSAIFRPKIYIDGNMWCALYGDNLQDGVAGFGDSPAAAMWDFDINWHAKLSAKKSAALDVKEDVA